MLFDILVTKNLKLIHILYYHPNSINERVNHYPGKKINFVIFLSVISKCRPQNIRNKRFIDEQIYAVSHEKCIFYSYRAYHTIYKVSIRTYGRYWYKCIHKEIISCAFFSKSSMNGKSLTCIWIVLKSIFTDDPYALRRYFLFIQYVDVFSIYYISN